MIRGCSQSKTMTDDSPSSTDERLGTTLRGKWHLDRLIGSGATATVYAATHRNGNRVAIKLLHRRFTANPDIRRRFLSEGYLANRIRHHGTVTVHDDDITDDDCPFLVLDLLEGQSVMEMAADREEPLGVGAVLAIADQVLETLGSAHSVGIVHRDLKPDNFFITTGGVVKLLDFGLAQNAPGRADGNAGVHAARASAR